MTELKNSTQEGNNGQTIFIQKEANETNGIGVAGFVCAIVALFLGWIPVIGWMIWLLGLVFSFIGVFKSPKGLSIAGLAISLIGVILLIAVFGVFAAAAASVAL